MANMYINAMTALWNSSGTTYSAIKMNVTNAASSAASMLIQLQTGSVDKFFVDKAGNATLAGAVNAVGIISSAAAKPSANDAAALGVSDTSWSDLYLASGGVINWNAGDVTLVHSANTLSFSGAGSGYLFDGLVRPSGNDNAALGAPLGAWSDLYLAVGAVIDWGLADLVLTHSANALDSDRRRSSGRHVGHHADVGGHSGWHPDDDQQDPDLADHYHSDDYRGRGAFRRRHPDRDVYRRHLCQHDVDRADHHQPDDQWRDSYRHIVDGHHQCVRRDLVGQ